MEAMPILTHEVKRSELAAGDHIYTWRKYRLYAHHGIYVGRNLVVHFFNPDWNRSSKSIFPNSSSSKTKSRRTCSNPGCEIEKDNNGVAIYCLDCFLENGSLHRYNYGATWVMHRLGGIGSRVKSAPAEIVVSRAMMIYLHHGFGPYNLILNNCEDFALYCKIGLQLEACSGQVSSNIPFLKFFKLQHSRRRLKLILSGKD